MLGQAAVGGLPLLSPAQTEAFPRYLQTGWNSSRASLNKQSTEKSKLLNTNDIKIDFHHRCTASPWGPSEAKGAQLPE